MYKRVAIVGVGLIGGSFALRIRQAFPKTQLHLIARKSKTLRLAKNKKILDSASQKIDSKLKDCDLILIATSLENISEQFEKIAPWLNPGALVIDVGSCKLKILEQIQCLPRAQQFLGAHPMAGSHLTGLKNSSAELLRDAVMVLTPNRALKQKVPGKLLKFLKTLGLKTLVMDAAMHDQAVAGISHLPYFMAQALVEQLRKSVDQKNKAQLAATGFRDTTRVAASDPSWGREIAEHNQAAILKELDGTLLHLKEFRDLIQNKDWKSLEKKLTTNQKLRKHMKLPPLTLNS